MLTQTICLILFTILFFLRLFGQNENASWHFGARVAIDFSSGNPQTNNTSRLFTLEGSASISDRITGKLLFYTDGDSIWNNQDKAMLPDGRIFGGVPAGSSTQSTLIVRKPQSDSVYYIFTVAENNRPEGFQYAVIDMSLNGGLGGIVNSKSQIHASVTEKLTAVYHCNGENIWIIAHEALTNNFIVLLLSDTGVSTPSVIPAGSLHDNVRGYMKAFCDPVLGGKIVSVKPNEPIGAAPELFDFDVENGQITFIGTLDAPSSGIVEYGLSFSSDHTKLYISQNQWAGTGPMEIIQYSLDAGGGNIDSIIASRYVVDSRLRINGGYGALQLAPDGKIYIAKHAKDTLAIIENPNLKGAACSFRYDGYAINSTLPIGYGKAYFGLPNLFEEYYYFDLQLDFKDTVCQDDSLSFKLLSDDIYDIYELIYDDGGMAELNVFNDFTDKYRFIQDGKHKVVLKAISITGCSRTFVVNVLVHPSPVPNIIVTDSVICSDETVQFDAGKGYANYIWSTDDTGRLLSVNDSQTYILKVVDSNLCSGIDSMHIDIINCTLNSLFIPNVFTPNGDNSNDLFLVSGNNIDAIQLAIYNQWGVTMFKTQDIQTTWNAEYRGRIVPPGMYVYFLSGSFADNTHFYRTGNIFIAY